MEMPQAVPTSDAFETGSLVTHAHASATAGLLCPLREGLPGSGDEAQSAVCLEPGS